MHLPVCVNKGEDIAFMCLGQSISDWLELTGGVSGNICKDITRRPRRQRKRLETAFLKPVSWKVFRLETLMRILGCNSFNKQQKTQLSCRFSATHMDVEVRWSLLKHNSMWVPDGLCSVSVTCQLEVGGVC